MLRTKGEPLGMLAQFIEVVAERQSCPEELRELVGVAVNAAKDQT